jgi:hypothetical protein
VFWRLPSGYPPSRTDPSGKWPPLPRLRASKAPTLGKKPRAQHDRLASARRRRWSITPFPNTNHPLTYQRAWCLLTPCLKRHS